MFTPSLIRLLGLAVAFVVVHTDAAKHKKMPKLATSVTKLLAKRSSSSYKVFNTKPLAGVQTGCKKSGVMAITWDDGPYGPHAAISKAFTAAGGLTTFFLNGYNWDCAYDEPFASAVKASYAAGHLLASHTWSHANLTAITTAQIDDQVSFMEEYLFRVAGVVPNIIRPPYGSVNDEVVKYLRETWGYTVATWTDDSLDSQGATSAEIKKLYTSYDGKKSHVMLDHEVHPESTDIVKDLVSISKGEGYKLQTMAQCLGIAHPYKVIAKASARSAAWNCDNKPKPGGV